MESLGTKTPLTARPVIEKVNNEEKNTAALESVPQPKGQPQETLLSH